MFYIGFINQIYFPNINIGWTNDLSLHKKKITTLYFVKSSDTIYLILLNNKFIDIVVKNNREPPPLILDDENLISYDPEDFMMDFNKLPSYEKYLLTKIKYLERENRILRIKSI
jgi:hypothetical protein